MRLLIGPAFVRTKLPTTHPRKYNTTRRRDTSRSFFFFWECTLRSLRLGCSQTGVQTNSNSCPCVLFFHHDGHDGRTRTESY